MSLIKKQKKIHGCHRDKELADINAEDLLPRWQPLRACLWQQYTFVMPVTWANHLYLQHAPAHNTWQSSSSAGKDNHGPRVMLKRTGRGARLAAMPRKQDRDDRKCIYCKFCQLVGNCLIIRYWLKFILYYIFVFVSHYRNFTRRASWAHVHHLICVSRLSPHMETSGVLEHCKRLYHSVSTFFCFGFGLLSVHVLSMAYYLLSSPVCS